MNMADKATKKARRPMTSVRMWKVTRDYVENNGLDTNQPIAVLLERLKDEALEEVAAQ